jgi:methyl-accepting chemotaxis protein
MYEQTEITNQSVQQITVAADLITGISEQTSLLALNANIEAAKAGEFGRGFAVVADEIGKLSQQSTESVEEIKNVLATLSANSEKSVSIMEVINKSVDTQVDSLAETQKVFGHLYEELDKCVESVKTIGNMTSDIDKQRIGVTDVLSVLNNLAQDNAAVTEETAAMSVALSDVVDSSDKLVKELAQKMEVLMEDVNRFTV